MVEKKVGKKSQKIDQKLFFFADDFSIFEGKKS